MLFGYKALAFTANIWWKIKNKNEVFENYQDFVKHTYSDRNGPRS